MYTAFMRSIQFLTPLLLHSGSQGCSVLSQLPLGVKVKSTPWRSRQFTAQKTNRHKFALSPMFMSLDCGWEWECQVEDVQTTRRKGSWSQNRTCNRQQSKRSQGSTSREQTHYALFMLFSSIHLPLRPKQTEMPIKLNRQVWWDFYLTRYLTEPLFIWPPYWSAQPGFLQLVLSSTSLLPLPPIYFPFRFFPAQLSFI